MSAEMFPPRDARQRQTEQALRDSQARLSGIIASAMDAIITVDASQRILLFNASAEKMFGYAAEEVLLAPLDMLLPERFRRAHREHIRHFGETGETNRAMGKLNTLYGLRRGGREFPIEASISQVQTSAGALYSVILRDVTERVRAEEALRDSEQQMRATFDQAAVGIAHLTPDGRLLRANHKLAQISGYPPAELAGMTTTELTAAEDLPHEQDLVRRLLAGEIDHYELEKRYLRKDGGRVWVDVTASLVRDAAGRPKYLIKIIEDISPRKASEAALHERTEQIRALNRQTEKRLQRLSALRTIDLAISSGVDLRVTMDIILDQVMSGLGVDAADILLYNRVSQTLDFAAGRGFTPGQPESRRVLLGSGPAGQAALEQNTFSIPDLHAAPHGDDDLPRAEGFYAYFVTPLVSKGETRGVLEVFHRAALNADPEWRAFFEALAGQAAIAIESAQLFDHLQRSNQQLFLAYNATIEGWSRALDLRDHETEGHTQRVTEMALRLAQAIDYPFSEDDLAQIRRGALLHDIGKMGVPDSVLLKPDDLTEAEQAVMRRHPEYAYQLLYPIVYLRKALDIPYSHHERWDGTGYPQGLKGEQIPLAARIFAVVDVWDALTSDRPYRPGWTPEQAADYIRERAGAEFDPQVVQVFFAHMPEILGHSSSPNQRV